VLSVDANRCWFGPLPRKHTMTDDAFKATWRRHFALLLHPYSRRTETLIETADKLADKLYSPADQERWRHLLKLYEAGRPYRDDADN
jgi:hypothetical protein